MMIVPQFWAEAKIKKHVDGKQVTIKRFGWSDESFDAAQKKADQRASEAMAFVESGKKINRSEPKRAYNGADGVPIREEIISRHNDSVITRNTYGALCLNTPDVLFADVDFDFRPSFHYYLFVGLTLLVSVPILSVILNSYGRTISIGILFLSVLIGSTVLIPVLGKLLFDLHIGFKGGMETLSLNRIKNFSENNPQWHLRIYRTPGGYRVLVMHKIFDPNSEETMGFFKALGADPVYVTMCRKQNCFRARLTPKPPRINIETHIGRGVWPISPEKIPAREIWVKNYEQISKDFAACRFEEKLGSSMTHSKTLQIAKLHDDYCKANSDFEIA